MLWLTWVLVFTDVEFKLSPEMIRPGRPVSTAILSGFPASRLDAQIQVFENQQLLGPRRTTTQEVRESGSGFFLAPSRQAFGRPATRVLYFAASDGSDPRHNGRVYVVRYPRRLLPASLVLMVVFWTLIPTAALRTRKTLKHGRGALERDWDVGIWSVAVAGIVFTLFAVQAWLPQPSAQWLLAVLAVGLPLFLERVARGQIERDSVVTLWILGFLAWGFATATGGSSYASMMSVGSVFGLCLAWLAMTVGFRGRLVRHPSAAVFVLSGLFIVAAVLSLARMAGLDVVPAFEAVGLSSRWPVAVMNHWTSKFLAHWFLILTWLAAATLSVRTRGRRMAVAVGAFVAPAVVGLSGSRTAIAAGLMSLVVVATAMRWPRACRMALVFFVMTAVLLAPALPFVVTQIEALVAQDPSTGRFETERIGRRAEVWGWSQGFVRIHPVAGWGFGAVDGIADAGALSATAPSLSNPAGSGGTRGFLFPGGHPHNAALQIWIDLGLVGALLAAGVVGSIGWSIARVEENRVQHAALLGLLTVNATYLAFNYSLWEPEVLSILWMTTALASTVLTKSEVSRRELVRNAIAVGVILMIGCSILAAERISRRLVARDLHAGTLQLEEGTVHDDGETWTLDYDSNLDAGTRVVQPQGVGRSLIQGWAYAPGRGEPDHVVVFVGSEPVQVVWPERPTKEVFQRAENRDVRALTSGFVFWAKHDWLAGQDPVTIVATFGDEHLAATLGPLASTSRLETRD